MLGTRLTPMRIAWGAALAMAALRLASCEALHRLDQIGLDFRFLQRGARPGTADVVIVAIDDASVEALGRWPWPRPLMARLIERLTELEPAVVGFDVVWSEPTTLEDDAALAGAVRASRRTILGSFLYFEPAPPGASMHDVSFYNLDRSDARGREKIRRAFGVRGNVAPIGGAAREVGYFNFPPAPDGYYRRAALAVQVGDRYALPLSLAMLRVHRNANLSIVVEEFGASAVRVGDVVVPVGEDASLLINYRGPRASFPYVSAADVLASAVAPDVLRGKLVLVGVTAVALGDDHPTSFDPHLPGVEIHANVLDNVLREDFLWQPRLVLLGELPLLVACTVGLGAVMRRTRGVAAAAAALGAAATYLGGTQAIFLAYGVPLTAVYALLGTALTYAGISLHQYVVVEAEKRQTRRYLELYLSPWLAGVLSERPELLRPEGEKREITVLFSDIRGFTTISEQLGADVVPLLNAYLAEMTDVIFREEGAVRYVGDAIMAWWNAPLEQPDHAERGCRAALAMVARLHELVPEWRRRGWPALRIGIGLNSGPMVFGSLGSENHLSFEIIGDHANLGSRLEGLTKHYGCTIIASESIVRAAAPALTCREIDCVRVKGRAEPTRIFEILGPAAERDRWALAIERFHGGLAAYRERRWDEALACFRRVLEIRPDDAPAALYVERCGALLEAPPPPNWDGITVMESK
jgi:adenylate cyclase